MHSKFEGLIFIKNRTLFTKPQKIRELKRNSVEKFDKVYEGPFRAWVFFYAGVLFALHAP